MIDGDRLERRLGTRLISRLANLLRLSSRIERQESIYSELVKMLYGTFVPVVIMAVSLGLVGAVAEERAQDHLAFLAAVGLAINVIRAGLIVAFRRRCSKSIIPVPELRLWERWYATGSYVFSLVLGLFNYSVAASEHSLTLMLSVGLIFAYGAGMIARVYARPKICLISISLAAVPTIAGFAVKGAEGGPDAFVFGGQALFISLFFLSAFEMVSYSYRAITTQLTDKFEFSNLARVDDLTQLPNRLSLDERYRANAEIARERDRMLFLHYLDLDGFKSINDRFGHPTGDALLAAVAARLSSTVREGDTVARIGGDEFVVLQAGLHLRSEAELLARRLIRAVGAPYVINGRSIVIGVSIGVAVAARRRRPLMRGPSSPVRFWRTLRPPINAATSRDARRHSTRPCGRPVPRSTSRCVS